MKENKYFVICPICGGQYKRLATNGHLQKHKLTIEQFKKLFPDYPTHCIEYGNKLSNSNIGKHSMSDEHKQKLKKINTGRTAWNKGLTKDTDNRIKKYGENVSITRLRKLRDGSMVHNSLGLKRTPEQRKRISEALIGHSSTKKGKTFIELYGVKRANTLKSSLRRIRIQQIQNNNGGFAAYNTDSVTLFSKFDKFMGTTGIYATAPMEYHIPTLGYWLDYINFELKLIIEYDEKHHYTLAGDLKYNDIIRQQKIEKYFHNFIMLRIREEFYKDVNEIEHYLITTLCHLKKE